MFQSSGKPKSRVLKNRSQDFGKTESNNTDINNTEYSDTESIISYEGDVEDEKSTKIKALKEEPKGLDAACFKAICKLRLLDIFAPQMRYVFATLKLDMI